MSTAYKIPKPFQDEDKWLRFFTKKQILFIGVPLAVSIFIIAKIYKSSSLILFLVSCLLFAILLACVIFSTFSMPKDKYIWGGGTSLERLGKRLIRKQLKDSKVLWVKNYGDHEPPAQPKKRNPLAGLIKYVD